MQGLKALLVIGLVTVVGLLSGCGGGGGDDSASVTRTFAGRTITVPARSTSTARTGSTTTGSPSETLRIPGVGELHASDLASFRACLRRHGVQPQPLDRGQSDSSAFGPGSGTMEQRLAKLRAQIEKELPARTACAPELPPALRSAFEQFRQRLQGAGQ
jgi:hypothetical protein